MTNILDSIKSLAFNEPEKNDKNTPLNVGEVMNLWTYVAALEEVNRIVEVALNTTEDKELIEALNNSFKDCSKHIAEVKEILREEGVPLPATASEPKPKSDPQDVPHGVKFTDAEIANLLILKQVSAIGLCTTGLTQSVRKDIGAMWLKFFLKRVEYSAYLRPIMLERGWLKVPPYYYPPGGKPDHK